MLRFDWALARLPRASRVLEIGCGTGMMLEKLEAPLVVGIDRSATAIAKARARNRAEIKDGRVVVRTGTLANVELPEAPFDLAFAINVNLVWTGDATTELARLRDVVRGPLYWFFVLPPGSGDRRIVEPAIAHLEEAGYRCAVERGELAPSKTVIIRAERFTSRARRSRRS